LTQDLIFLTETNDGENFKNQLRAILDDKMSEVKKNESHLTFGEKGKPVLEVTQKKGGGPSLEKLNAMELESIRKELTRQRDTMSKKLIRNSEINARLEKEREHVFNEIQREGKTLITKCNILRRAGLILKYKIGMCEKDAKSLTDNIGSSMVKQEELKSQVASQPSRLPKPSRELPFLEYKKRQQQEKRLPGDDEGEEDEELRYPGQLIYGLVERRAEENREIDRLYKQAEEAHLDVREYQNKLHNFVGGNAQHTLQMNPGGEHMDL
jgi:hypothetical protein